MSFTDHRWTTGRPNLLSAEVIAMIRSALDEGLLCGLHAYYCQGRGPDPCAFADFASYKQAIERSRPGDRFTLWSVPQLASEHRLLLHKQNAAVSEDEILGVKAWLQEDPWHEFIAVGRAGAEVALETAWGDFDSFDDLCELASRCALPFEFAVLSLTDLLERGTRSWIPRFA